MKKMILVMGGILAVYGAIGYSPALSTIDPLPNKQVSPGYISTAVTQSNIHTTICVPYYTKTVRPSSYYTNSVKTQQLQSTYRYENTDLAQYEEDHIVPLTLGGHPTDIRNLWPQPRYIEYGAAKKDQLEVYLKKQVCNGKLPLVNAQTMFMNNWTVAYKFYKLRPGKQSKLISTENTDD